jgi:hypothetical protein
MATAENAKLQYEAGQNAVAMSALTDSGDATNYTSAATLWSGRSGYTPVIRPNGLLTGGVCTVTATNNQLAVASLTLNLQGVVTSVTGANTTVTRPATAVSKVCSITINNAGAITVVTGTDGATTAFSETRAAAGGPPLIPVDSVEIAQVRMTSNVAAPLAAAEVYQVVGLHQERADFPLYDVNYGAGKVTFISANPAHHTGAIGKKVYASYATPIFADVALASDFVPPETSNSVTSTQVYGTTLGSTSSTLNQGTFTAYLTNGVSDALVLLKNATLWFKFFPDRNASPYILSQGKLGIARTFPAGDQIQAACTISAAAASTEVSS